MGISNDSDKFSDFFFYFDRFYQFEFVKRNVKRRDYLCNNKGKIGYLYNILSNTKISIYHGVRKVPLINWNPLQRNSKIHPYWSYCFILCKTCKIYVLSFNIHTNNMRETWSRYTRAWQPFELSHTHMC